MSDVTLRQRVPLLNACSRKPSQEDEQIEEKRCFLHVRYLSIGIALTELAILSYQLLTGSWSSSENVILIIFSSLLLFLVCILLFLAIFYQIGVLLVPHIVMQTMIVLSMLGMAGFALYALFSGASLQILLVVTNPEKAAESLISLPSPMISTSIISSFLCGTLLLFFLMYLVGAIVNVWCLRIVIDCYKFLAQQKLKRHRNLSEEAEYCAPKTVQVQMAMFSNRLVSATDF
ncbi:unnamed protein product [Caenorhabditis angaria]|uniref:Uncharacterized protein n=1 Tax=Caenorhabditis angaria TaxID=860376 RepID=A0A9P1MXJ4_9PELO|nr:unnamed protein product [Caenorhabditis angaria]